MNYIKKLGTGIKRKISDAIYFQLTFMVEFERQNKMFTQTTPKEAEIWFLGLLFH